MSLILPKVSKPCIFISTLDLVSPSPSLLLLK